MSSPTIEADILGSLVVTIDGPSGSGKTTTAREVARRMSLRHLDTGAMYRAVTLRALRANLDLQDEDAVAQVAESSQIEFVEQTGKAQRVLLNGQDVSEAIRSADVTSNVSLVSSYRRVRTAMVGRQRALADTGGVVLEGRDIGSVVLPSADVKIYLDASIDVRAERRCKEIRSGGGETDVASIRKSLEDRDKLDTTRDVSPLMIPVGARIVDTSDLSIEEQVQEVVRTAEQTAERTAQLIHPNRRSNRFMRKRFIWWFCQQGTLVVLRIVWGLRIYRKDRTSYLEPYIFASNHRSNLDPPVIGATVDREVHFVAKRSLFENKLFGRFIRFLNSVPIRRGKFDRTAMERFLQVLGSGQSVLIFPEGGRVGGEELGDARPGVGFLALKSGRPVLPVYVDGTHRMGRAAARNPRLTVTYGKPMRLTDVDLEKYTSPDQYRDFGRMVMAAIGAIKEERERSNRGRTT